jgi:hypothetical protein
MRHFLNGVEIAPRNLDEIGFVSDYTDNPEIDSISVDSVILPREAKKIIQDHIQNVGLFEGIPYQIETDGVTLEYYVDFLGGIKIRDNDIEVNIKKRKSIDDFFERAKGSSFEILNTNGVQFTSHDVPYFVIPDNQFETSLQLAVVTFIMFKETYEAGERFGEALNLLTEAGTPIPVVVFPSAGVGFNVPAIVGNILKVIITLIYFALMIIALINVATKLFLVLFPPKRKLKGIYFKELLEKSCEHFGYTFQSDLLTEQPFWTLVPVPIVPERESLFQILPEEIFPVFNNGYPSSSDTTPSVYTFIQALENMFNAKVFIFDNVVRLERRDWLQNQTLLQLTPALALQSERSDEFTYNTEDVWKRYYLHYNVDFTDLYTADGKTYDAHVTEKSTEPSFPVTNDDLVLIKGLNEVIIPFSLGARKDKLTFVEKLAKETLQLIDALTGIFGGGTNFAQQIDNRKNAMKISQTYFSGTKVIYGQAGAITSGQIVQTESDFNNIVSASALYEKYHKINEIQVNDYIIRENVRIRISAEDFVSLQNNNFVEINGVIVEILRLEWIDEKSFAQISYKQPFNWANGLTNVLNIT